MHQDFKELLSAFNAGQVRYLIVGGYAVSFHAQPRATKDLDILIGADAENSKAVYTALAKFGAPERAGFAQWLQNLLLVFVQGSSGRTARAFYFRVEFQCAGIRGLHGKPPWRGFPA